MILCWILINRIDYIKYFYFFKNFEGKYIKELLEKKILIILKIFFEKNYLLNILFIE